MQDVRVREVGSTEVLFVEAFLQRGREQVAHDKDHGFPSKCRL